MCLLRALPLGRDPNLPSFVAKSSNSPIKKCPKSRARPKRAATNPEALLPAPEEYVCVIGNRCHFLKGHQPARLLIIYAQGLKPIAAN